MRTLDQARSSWHELQTVTSVEDFRKLLQTSDDNGVLSSRSVYWKLFLLFEKVDHTIWLRKLGDSRSAYASLRGHLLRAIDHPDEVDIDEDPLSEDTSSPWKSIRHDEEMRVEIMQDVERCMPDNTYFRLQRTQTTMLDILFIFCKLNPDVGYRQGMHELLAPILWVIEGDAIENGTHGSEDFMISQLCDSRFMEHDAFTLFSLVMQNAKHFYEQKAHRRQASHSKQPSGKLENPIITVINRIFDDYLPRLDPELATHLRDIELLPQVFLMRWVRLLFGREFPFDHLLPLWDVLFSRDPNLDLVEMICLVMLLRLRYVLLLSDHNECLTLLLRYPALPSGFQPRDLALDATLLRQSFTQATARDIIQKYTGQVPAPSTSLPDPDDFAILDDETSRPPISTQRSPRNFESLLQNAAKDVLSRGEKWGINKAVRDAVEEVRKGVRDMQTMQTPTPPRRHSRTQSRTAAGLTAPVTGGAARRPDLERKLGALQRRNEQLAAMLKEATDQLWEFQRVVSEGTDNGKEEEEEEEKGRRIDSDKVKALGMSIARVGFVQVYLEDASIPLPVEEEKRAEKFGAVHEGPAEAEVEEAQRLPSSTAHPKTEGAAAEHVQDPISVAQITAKPATPMLDPDASRPTLAQSSFSWMLGQEERSSPFLEANSSPMARPRSRGFLFGDDDDDAAGATDAPSGTDTPTRKRREKKMVRKGGAAAGRKEDEEEEEDGFNLNELKSSGGL